MNLFHYASPQPFYGLAGRCWPWLAALATVLGVAGLWLGLAVAPTDAQQGEGYRIIFVHVPASWMSMIIYLAMAFWGVLGLDLQHPPVGHDDPGARAHGGHLCFSVAVDRGVVGQAHVGHMVGVGCSPHVRADSCFFSI